MLCFRDVAAIVWDFGMVRSSKLRKSINGIRRKWHRKFKVLRHYRRMSGSKAIVLAEFQGV